MDSVKTNALLARYLQADIADNTKLAYGNDVAHFKRWGGSIPASAEVLATYLASYAGILANSTLSRHLVAIHHAHTQHGLASPASHALVKATMQGIKRVHGTAQRQVQPLFKQDIEAMVSRMQGLKGCRDKALMLIGFAGALRRAELVSLLVEDATFVSQGVVLRVRRSKTDQTGVGHDIPIPYVKGRCCAVKALKAWLLRAGLEQGPIFRGVSRHGAISNQALGAQSVALLVKHYANAAGLDATRLSGHSLRVGMVTNAARSGADLHKIRQQTRHQSDAMVQRYIRDSELFINHPVKAIWSG